MVFLKNYRLRFLTLPSTAAWWEANRCRYNIILMLAASVSFICLFVIWWLFEARLPCLEITGFSILFGGILFLIGLILANICYFLGPLSEKLFHPNNPPVFRRTLFVIGTGFSLLLIFFPVIGNLIAAAVGPEIGGNCG